MHIAKTPDPPYYAVVFTSVKDEASSEGYDSMADRMFELVTEQPGFLGFETAGKSDGITVSYWKDLESIKAWKANEEHLIAQQKGRNVWYDSYKIRICKVEKVYQYP